MEREQGVRYTSLHPSGRALALPTPVGFALQGQGPESKCRVREKSCPTSSGQWCQGSLDTELPGDGGHSSADRRPVDTEKAKALRAPGNGTLVFCQSCAVPYNAE